VVTAKDKLRRLLGHGMKGICFSSEKANETTDAEHGIADALSFVGRPLPSVYSADLSEFVFAAGVRLMERQRPDIMYLSTTDYVQHKAAPGTPAANAFLAMMDRYLGELDRLGATVVVTADHGMNAKQRNDGAPNVIYLEPLLREKFGDGYRVVLPITDPYVLHHGALGSFAVIYAAQGADLRRVATELLSMTGITEVIDRATAVPKMELPGDRLGDLVVVSGRDVVLGLSPEKHDLKAVASGLRSHGGRYEEMVPFIFSAPLNKEYAQRARGDVRNFDVFDFVCNGLEA
jgi:phosphonoacetate hydrolase